MDAKIILIGNDEIDDGDTPLSVGYQNGALIAVFNPDGSILEDWSDRNDIFYAGPQKLEKCAIYGFNKQGTYYSIADLDGIDDGDTPLFHFCKWVNITCGKRYQAVNLRSNDIKQRFTPQSITHTFKVSLDPQQIADEHWGAEGQLTLSTTANLTCNIYPVHVFEGSTSGDYYFIEAEMVLHNGAMNNGTWARRRGTELTQMAGFYLNRCNISAAMLRKSNGTYSEVGSFAANPKPANADNAVDYNPGFEWALNATVSGGVPDDKDNHLLTSTNNWKWNSTSKAELPGIAINNSSSSAAVDFTLRVNGLPGANDNLTVTPVPDAATGDLVFKFSWIWHASDMGEGSKEPYFMEIGINPTYLAYQWITGGKMTIGELENALPDSKATFRVPLTPPNRTATCSAIFRNTSTESYYVSDIKLWLNKSTDGEPDFVLPQTICTSSATGGSGVSATMKLLPAGNYNIKGTRYSMENDQRINEQIITNAAPITLTKGDTITIDFDKFTPEH